MSDVKPKKVKPMVTELVKYETFAAWEFIPPGSFYIRNANGDFLFLKTSDRIAAQKYIDENYGKGRYTVIPAKAQTKTVSRLESGGLSCTGTATRRGQMKH